MEQNEDSINILDLPHEVLHQILSFIPFSDQLRVGQVCKTFYTISCSLQTCVLSISTEGLGSKIVNLNNESICESILNSERKIETLFIPSTSKGRKFRKSFRKVVEKVSGNIKELGICQTYLTINRLSLLNLMTNLQKLELNHNSCSDVHVPPFFKLELFHLRELKIYKMSAKFLEIFDRLPDDVLQKVTLSDIKKPDKKVKYFQNQRNIKYINAANMSMNCFYLDQLNLKSLKAKFSHKSQDALAKQHELTSLSISFIDFEEDHLDFICKNMKLLVKLSVSSNYDDDYIDLSMIQQLEHLENLSLQCVKEVESWKQLKSNSLKLLNLESINREVAMSISVNCPNLRELVVLGFVRGFNIDELLNHFPKLEKLNNGIGDLKFADGWENNSLTHFRCPFAFDEDNIKVFMKSCKGLKSFTTLYLSPKSLKELLISNPNMKTICLFSWPKREGLEIIEEHGKNLDGIHFMWCTETSEYMETTKRLLEHKFPVWKMKRTLDGFQFSMKKRGVKLDCCRQIEIIWV